MRRFVVVALVLLPAWLTAQTPFDPPGRTVVPSPVTVPLTSDPGGRPAVSVMINGKGPYRMGIDWGANIVTLSDRVAGQLALPAAGAIDAGRGSQPTYRVDELTIGAARLGQLTVFTGGFLDTSVDGILGFNCFADLLMTFDFPAGVLRLDRGTLPAANGQDILPLAATDTGRLLLFDGWHPGEPLPRAYFGDRSTTSSAVSQPSVMVSIGGTHYSAVLDTRSSSWITLPDSLITRLHLAGHQVQGIGLGPQAGTMALTRSRITDPVLIGTQRFDQTPITFRDRPGPIVGMGLMRLFAITLDQRSGRVRLAGQGRGPIVVPAEPGENDSNTVAVDPAAFVGLYGQRRITQEQGQLFLQRTDPPPANAGGRQLSAPRLRMIARGGDQFGLEGVPQALLHFERDSTGHVIRLGVRQPDGTWQSADRATDTH